METIFRLNNSELEVGLIETLKKLFNNKTVEISVKQITDETEYLINNSANKKKDLLDAIEVKENKNLVHFTGEEFVAYSKKKLSIPRAVINSAFEKPLRSPLDRRIETS